MLLKTSNSKKRNENFFDVTKDWHKSILHDPKFMLYSGLGGLGILGGSVTGNPYITAAGLAAHVPALMMLAKKQQIHRKKHKDYFNSIRKNSKIYDKLSSIDDKFYSALFG